MLSPDRRFLRTAWIGLALLLPALYVAHAVPHAHAGKSSAHPHPEPTPAAHHHHPAGHDDPAPESADASHHHHHHALDDHFASDPVRLQKRNLGPDPGSSIEFVEAVVRPEETRSEYVRVPEPDAPIFPGVSGVRRPRAPPRHS